MEPPSFSALMQRLDEFQALRYTEPRRALMLLAEARKGWPPMPAAESSLLKARFAMQEASAHVVLGEHAAALPLFECMQQALATPELQSSSGSLLEQALKKSGWRGPRETGAQRLKRVLDRGRAEREEHGHGGQQGL